jgi:hypothetical protein
MATIEIFDRDQGGTFPDLKDLLSVIEPFGSNLDWYLVEFEPWLLAGAEGSTSAPPEWVVDLSDAVRKDSTGHKLDWVGLNSLAKYIGQIENILLLATSKRAPSPRVPIDLNSPEWLIVLQAIDATFWAVTSRNEALLDAIRSRFHKTETVTSATRYF